MICPRLSPPPAKTPPIIRHGTQIMPPAQTAAMDSQKALPLRFFDLESVRFFTHRNCSSLLRESLSTYQRMAQ